MGEVGYASVRALGLEASYRIRPPKRFTVDEYAVEHRKLNNSGGGYVGRWRHEVAPYLVMPQRCLRTRMHLTTCVVGPGQSGKTSIGENWLLHSVGSDPADMLWYMQTDESCEAYVKGRINPMIDAHEQEMRANLGQRPIDDSLHFKRFAGMVVEWLSATESNLINKKAGRIIADEIDAYSQSFGDPKVQLDVRRQTFGRLSMLLAMSHCDLAKGIDPKTDWDAGIMSIYADSDRRVWYWPCPHCGAWSSPVPIAARVMTLEYPQDGTLDEVENEAHLKCPVNGCVIEDHHRRGMNLEAYRSPFGGWIGDGQEISEDGTVTGGLIRRDTAGFWIVGAMSPFLLSGIGGLARARAKAEREFEVSGEDKTLKEVVVKQWGFPYKPPRPVGSVDAETLAERAEGEIHPLGVVPDGVRFLTAWMDIQVAHFELLVRGWGPEGESWVIDKSRIPADTATDRGSWDALLEGLITKRYPLVSNPSLGMAIRAIGYDSGGAPGVTEQAYSAWRRLRDKKLLRNYGRLDGRDIWSVLPTKGASSQTAPKLSVTYPDSARKDRKVARTGNVPLALFNSNTFKDDLALELRQPLPGPGFVHFPKDLRSKESPHVNFEQLVAEKRKSNGQWERSHRGARNETLDLMVGTAVLAFLHGIRRIKWQAPPVWAAAEKNSMVGPITPVIATPSSQSAPQAATPPAKPRSIFDLLD